MQSRRARMTFVMAAVTGVLWALAPSASAAEVVVNPGQSIQAAIDAAPPGTTITVRPGTYRENLLITKNNIWLRGSGRASTFLRPPATPATNDCAEEPGLAPGICLLGDVDFESGRVIAPVRDIRVTGFNVAEFDGPGMFIIGGLRTVFRTNESSRNGEYGIFALVSSEVTFDANVTRNNIDAGLYIGVSPQAKAVISRNSSRGNLGEGILLLEASQGQVYENDLSENCAGLAFLNIDLPGDPGGWIVKTNTIRNNNRFCPGSEDGAPPMSGIGVLVAGARDIALRGNNVLDNGVNSGPSAFGNGGILVSSTAHFGGADPRNIGVVKNILLRNQSEDLFWDGTGTGNTFTGNTCSTSTPDGLCN